MRAVWKQVKTDARETLNKVCETWGLRWLVWAVTFIPQETLCEREKVMPNFAGTGGCFICRMCVFVCISQFILTVCWEVLPIGASQPLLY